MAYQSGELDDLGIFVTVVQSGGFSAAARALGARKAQISRRVQRLERRLGVRLLERTTRAVRLTEIGITFYAPASRAIALAEEARAAIESGRHEPVGLLRISTTQLLAELVLKPVVLTYLGRHPRVAVELDATARRVDLVREGFDLALRVGVPTDSNLVGRVIGKGQAIYLAAPAFLAKTAPIARPQELAQLDAILIADGSHQWTFQSGRRSVIVRPRARLTTPSFHVAREAALAGIGIARLPSYFVAADLVAGRLEQILTLWTPPEVSIMAVYPSRDLIAPKTSAFLELLSGHVAKHPLLAA